jgi:hypothetical protein
MTSTARNGLPAVVGPILRWAVLLALACSGCVTTMPETALAPNEPPPCRELPCQIVTWWQPQVRFSPDPARHGANNAGLAGRVYLFGQDMSFPLIADGALVIDLYDETSNQPVLLEEWKFDKETLKKQARRDAVGWGYTVFLPWGTYRPEISKVWLKARFEPLQGLPLYAPDSHVTLANQGAMSPDVAEAMARRQVLPATTPPANPVPLAMPVAGPIQQTQALR